MVTLIDVNERPRGRAPHGVGCTTQLRRADGVAQALTLGGTGIAVGVFGALSVSRFVGSFLWGIEPNDPVTTALASSVLLMAVLAAGAAPAWRASRIDPTVALRCE